ncbi:MAG TPA: CDP-glycerol glycerophosphotransferase family protein, partial [Candidatus Paceibacterota bacterium]
RFGDRHVKSNEMTYEDLLHLADSLHWSEVVVSSASTIAIDAAALGKPIVLTAFDGRRQKPYYESVRHYFDFNHMRNLTATGGVVVAGSEDAFIEALRAYLKNSFLHVREREGIVREQCYVQDGKASERLANVLLVEAAKS